MVGLGVWKAPAEVTAQVVYDAVKIGYRHLDCACDYGNEKAVGQALKRVFDEGICSREDMWITSKLWNTYHKREHVLPACQRTLDDLGLEYVDLYLIHFPISLEFVPFEQRYPPEWYARRRSAALQQPRWCACAPVVTAIPLPPPPPAHRAPGRTDEPNNAGVMQLANVPYRETWEAMEALKEAGKAKAIGVSNLNVQSLIDLLRYCKVRPACNQIENHVYLTQPKLVDFCHDQDIGVVAFSPLGAVSYIGMGMAEASENALNDPVVVKIAQAKKRTPAQVLLRFQIERGVAVIPKSEKVERLKENLALFDFSLTPEEVKELLALDRRRRFNDPAVYAKGWGPSGSWLAKHGYPIYE